ncbi:unnamed protein product [Thlaspi arvense]|uniref:Squalene cyclase N-terminal domain-containing protein n=1 Tax=Thlaspi arvense TaxID=13288 RepID=A0AAU9SCQ5_THLAR|nr:unnamed protein product [Thlaspi arvense]
MGVASSPKELEEVVEARKNFSDNMSNYKASADLLWRMQFLREKKFEQKIPRVRIEGAEKITYEDARTVLRRGILYMAAFQSDDGHWPAENAGCIFFNAPFSIGKRCCVTCTTIRPGWWVGNSHSFISCTVINYICLRMFVEPDHDGQQSACARARKWILDHGGATYTSLFGKTWLSVLGVYEWSGCKPIPPEFWILPSWFPISGATSTSLILQLREELYPQPYTNIVWRQARNQCAKPFNKLIREKAIRTAMELIHYHGEATQYITGGAVPKVFYMLASWVEDQESDYFKKHLGRVPGVDVLLTGLRTCWSKTCFNGCDI